MEPPRIKYREKIFRPLSNCRNKILLKPPRETESFPFSYLYNVAISGKQTMNLIKGYLSFSQ